MAKLWSFCRARFPKDWFSVFTGKLLKYLKSANQSDRIVALDMGLRIGEGPDSVWQSEVWLESLTHQTCFGLPNFFAFSWSTRSSDVCFSVHIYSHPDSQVFLLFRTPDKACFLLSIAICLQSSNREQNFPNMRFYLMYGTISGKLRGKTLLREHIQCRNEQNHCCTAAKQAAWCSGREREWQLVM